MVVWGNVHAELYLSLLRLSIQGRVPSTSSSLGHKAITEYMLNDKRRKGEYTE